MINFQSFFSWIKKKSIASWTTHSVSRNVLDVKRRSCERNAHLLSKNKGDGVRDVGKSNTDEHTNLEKEKDNLLAMITLGRLTMTPESKVKRKVYEILKKYNDDLTIEKAQELIESYEEINGNKTEEPEEPEQPEQEQSVFGRVRQRLAANQQPS